MADDEISVLLTRKTAYPGRIVHLDLERVRLPGGAVVELEIVHHPGAACVLPFVTRDEVVLVRQFRHAVSRWLLEAPAGKLDRPGEDPLACARRELQEETGFVAGRLVPLGPLHVTPGFCDETIHLFAAFDLVPGEAHVEHDEVLAPVRLPFAEALAMARDGRITDAKTMAAFLRAGALPG